MSKDQRQPESPLLRGGEHERISRRAPGPGGGTWVTRVAPPRLDSEASPFSRSSRSVLLAVALIGFLVRNGVYVVAGAAGFALGVAGGWWAITKRAPRRGCGHHRDGGGCGRPGRRSARGRK